MTLIMGAEFVKKTLFPQNQIEKRPVIIFISTVDQPPQTLMNNVDGFISKSRVLDMHSLEEGIREVLNL